MKIGQPTGCPIYYTEWIGYLLKIEEKIAKISLYCIYIQRVHLYQGSDIYE